MNICYGGLADLAGNIYMLPLVLEIQGVLRRLTAYNLVGEDQI